VTSTAARRRESVEALDRDRIDVWMLPLSADLQAQCEPFRALLSEDERRRSASYVRDEDRIRFAIARACLRLLLADYLRTDPRSLTFGVQPHGKPVLLSPHGTVYVQFNLSHSERLIAWAIGCERAVGIDVEHVPRLRTLSEHRHAFLSPAEEHVVAAMPEADRVARMSEYWTLKEAFVKATGAGLRSNVTQLTFEIGPDSGCRLAPDNEDASRWEFRLVRPHDGYVLGLCAQRTDRPLDVQMLEFIPTDWRKKSTV
jgi:4'-phosphopantetheinyl transferase